MGNHRSLREKVLKVYLSSLPLFFLYWQRILEQINFTLALTCLLEMRIIILYGVVKAPLFMFTLQITVTV